MTQSFSAADKQLKHTAAMYNAPMQHCAASTPPLPQLAGPHASRLDACTFVRLLPQRRRRVATNKHIARHNVAIICAIPYCEPPSGLLVGTAAPRGAWSLIWPLAAPAVLFPDSEGPRTGRDEETTTSILGVDDGSRLECMCGDGDAECDWAKGLCSAVGVLWLALGETEEGRMEAKGGELKETDAELVACSTLIVGTGDCRGDGAWTAAGAHHWL